MGYAGGVEADPTYRRIGSHAEALRVLFDPTVIDFTELLEVLGETHTPRRSSGQYRSLIFPTRAQLDTTRSWLTARGDRVTGLVLPDTPQARFWDAEDYHQKYRLRRRRELVRALEQELGPSWDRFPVATKLNSGQAEATRGWLAGLSEPTRQLALSGSRR